MGDWYIEQEIWYSVVNDGHFLQHSMQAEIVASRCAGSSEESELLHCRADVVTEGNLSDLPSDSRQRVVRLGQNVASHSILEHLTGFQRCEASVSYIASSFSLTSAVEGACLLKKEVGDESLRSMKF